MTHPTTCPAGSTAGGDAAAPLHSGDGTAAFRTSIRPGKSTIANDDFALFAQDQWQIRPNLTLNYGLRWDAQLMPDTVDPSMTAYAPFVNNPAFLSDGTIPDQTTQFQPRVGIAWDVKSNGRTLDSRQLRLVLRAQQHAEPGRV